MIRQSVFRTTASSSSQVHLAAGSKRWRFSLGTISDDNNDLEPCAPTRSVAVGIAVPGPDHHKHWAAERQLSGTSLWNDVEVEPAWVPMALGS